MEITQQEEVEEETQKELFSAAEFLFLLKAKRRAKGGKGPPVHSGSDNGDPKLSIYLPPTHSTSLTHMTPLPTNRQLGGAVTTTTTTSFS